MAETVDGWKVGFTSSSITVTTTLLAIFLVDSNLQAVFAATLATALGNSVSDGISVGTSNAGPIDFSGTWSLLWRITSSELLVAFPLCVAFGVLAVLQRRQKYPKTLPRDLSWKFKGITVAIVLLWVGGFMLLTGEFVINEEVTESLIRVGIIWATIVVVSLVIYGVNLGMVVGNKKPDRNILKQPTGDETNLHK